MQTGFFAPGKIKKVTREKLKMNFFTYSFSAQQKITKSMGRLFKKRRKDKQSMCA
jgi:hypothetical protein